MVLARTIVATHDRAVLLHRCARVFGLMAIASVPACATVPRRAEVVSLASRILDCPPQSISVRRGPIDQICTDRSRREDGVPASCLGWMPLDGARSPELEGWIVEGCGQVDRYATPSCGEGGIYPAEIAFGGFWDCPTD